MNTDFNLFDRVQIHSTRYNILNGQFGTVVTLPNSCEGIEDNMVIVLLDKQYLKNKAIPIPKYCLSKI